MSTEICAHRELGYRTPPTNIILGHCSPCFFPEVLLHLFFFFFACLFVFIFTDWVNGRKEVLCQGRPVLFHKVCTKHPASDRSNRILRLLEGSPQLWIYHISPQWQRAQNLWKWGEKWLVFQKYYPDEEWLKILLHRRRGAHRAIFTHL